MDQEMDSLWEIHPHIGVGILRFGQTRTAVRSLLGRPSRVFKKAPFATSETDAYDALGIHTYFDDKDGLESIDAWGPSPIQFEGLKLLNVSAETVARKLAEHGYEHRSHVFDAVGVSLYLVDNIVNGVSVFPPGCCDESNPDSPISRALRAADVWRKNRSPSGDISRF